MRTFSLGAGADTVVFESTVSANGVDTITGFTAGARGDVLAIGSGTSVNGLLGSAFNASNFFVSTTDKGNLTGKQVLIHAGSTAINEAAANSSSFDDNGTDKYKIDDGQKLFIVDTVNNNNILYLATGGASGNVKVEKVGTLNAGSAITLTVDNFGDVA